MESLERLKSGNISSASSSSCVGDEADIAPLRACSFPCLESQLRKMRLEFKLKCFDCFEVRLAKFFVENALVLEEMEVHDGDQRVSDHIHRNLPIWRANSSKSKIKVDCIACVNLFRKENVELISKDETWPEFSTPDRATSYGNRWSSDLGCEGFPLLVLTPAVGPALRYHVLRTLREDLSFLFLPSPFRLARSP
ncbi:hypothetical protein HU200_051965 [Digitaria exilis]|uniref:FBD domain-containing protein n=1 Tax=Digitaria exilis TaxID=1010633 RepID=A0A835API6_9POAL|nr:hypothetical protein HU200_051965 [Digitaria exilis]